MCSRDDYTHHGKSKTSENKKEAMQRNMKNQKFLFAIDENNLEEVNKLMESIDINFKDQDGCTPLHWSVESGNMEITEILLNNGADLRSINNDLKTPLDVAKQMNHVNIIKILEKSLHATEESRVTEVKQSSEWDRKSTSSPDQDVAVWINPVHGFIYQLKLLMLFLHRGLACKYSFQLGTEIKEAKKFDDLVFEYIQDDKKVYRLLQAKHKFDESKKITVDKLLTDDRGDYSLVKYFYSFQACKKDKFFKDGVIKDVIICTNIDFDYDDLNRNNIELKKVQEKDDILDMKSDKKVSTRYKFKNTMVGQLKYKLRPSVTYNEIENFLNHLIFAVNQPNEEELGLILKNEIGKEMGFLDSEIAFNKLLIKVMDLSMGKGKSRFLSHEEGEKLFNDLKEQIPIWFNIQNPVSSFTGRLEDLEKIHQMLEQNSQVCISGMGGVGKTEIARKYVADYGGEYDNQVVWINAESYRSASECFFKLASDKLNINLKNADGKDKHISSIVTAVYQIFSKNKSLFIFDNAEKYKNENELDCGIEKFLPCLPENCIKPKVIITSRNQKWPASIKTIVLKAFTEDEARELLEKKLSFENVKEKELIVELVEKLQFLPLALEQAIAYIKMQKEKLTCLGLNFGISNYLEKYSEMTDKLLDFKFSEESDSNYDKSVYATWNITFDTLKQKENGQEALNILNIMSYFHAENIPIDLLIIFMTDVEKLSTAIGLLKQYSIISVQHKSISIHRLVQEVTRIKQQKENVKVEVLQNALKLLNQGNVNFKNINHVTSMWTFASHHIELIEEYSRLSGVIMQDLCNCGRFEEALAIGNQISTLKTLYPDNKHVTSAFLTAKNIAAVCTLNKGEYKKALEEFEELVEGQKTLLESSVDRVLVTKTNSVHALIKLGRYQEALDLSYEILKLYTVNSKESKFNIFLNQCSISVILAEQGRHKEALFLMRRAYDVLKVSMGDQHPTIFTIRKTIANLTGKINNNAEESLKIMKEICKDEEAIFPKNHPNILETKLNVAGMLTTLEKYSPALKIYRELLDIKREKFGEDHPDVIDINIRISVLLHNQNKYEESLKILRKAFKKQQMILGPKHPTTFKTQRKLVEVFFSLERYNEGIKLAKDLLDKQISVFGDVHPETIGTRKFLSIQLQLTENFDEALKHNLDLIDIIESISGKNHPETLNQKSSIAAMYTCKKDFDKALEIFNEVLEVQENTLGKNHNSYRRTKKHIADVIERQEKFEKIEEEITNYKQLLQKPGVNFNKKDRAGDTVLYQAVYEDNEQMVDFLLDHGRADVFVINKKGFTPLHVAVLNQRKKFVKILLEKIKREKLKDYVDVQTQTGFTALHFAAETCHFYNVKYLLKNHATFCLKNEKGKTPRDMTTDQIVKNFLNMVHELFENVKRADVTEIVEKLEELSPDEFLAVTNTRNEQGSTLAQVAILHKRKDVAVQILKMVKEFKPQ